MHRANWGAQAECGGGGPGARQQGLGRSLSTRGSASWPEAMLGAKELSSTQLDARPEPSSALCTVVRSSPAAHGAGGAHPG